MVSLRVPDTGGSCRLIALTVLLAAVLASCQTFPSGEHIETLDGREDPSVEELYTYYSMCRAVWRERETWQDTGWDLDYFTHPPTNTMAFSMQEEDTLYFVFRSSQAPEDPVDSRLNYQFGLHPLFFSDDPKMRAHLGMMKKYEGIYNQVHRRIDQFDGDTLLLIGHSAGGMTATIAFFDLYHAYPELETRLITFGTPRVLNRRAAEALEPAEDQIIRVVMGRDFFASIPPALFGYRHAGRLIRIGNRPIWKPFSISDHYPGYQDELKRLQEDPGL